MKKISTLLGISSTVIFLSLGLSFSTKVMSNENKNAQLGDSSVQINQNKDNISEPEYLDKNENTTNNKDFVEDEEINNSEINNNTTDNDTTDKIDVVENETETETEKVELVTSSGIFEGFADSNFIEVNINGEYSVFRIENETIKNNLSDKEAGSNITFKYIEKDNSKIIKELN